MNSEAIENIMSAHYWPGTTIRIIFPDEITLSERHLVDHGKIYSCSNMNDLMKHIHWLEYRRKGNPERLPDHIFVMGKLAEELKDNIDVSKV
jgi:hypothetical protein